MSRALVLAFQGTEEEEKEILKNLYEIYLKYVQLEISEDEYIDLLKSSEIQRLASGNVEYSSPKSLDRACFRFSNLYYKKVLGKEDSWLVDLKKKNDEYRKKHNPEQEPLLKEMYETYVSYADGKISEEQFHQKVLDTDFSVLNSTVSDDLFTCKRSYILFAKKYATDYLNMTPDEFNEIKEKLVSKAELELYDSQAKPLLEKIYNCYWDYLNKKIGEAKFYQKIRSYGIEKFSATGSVDDDQLNRLLGRCINYYSKSILKINTATFNKMRNDSPLYREKAYQDSISKYSKKAIKMMKNIYENYFHYLNMDIDYSTYQKFVDSLDISVITGRYSYHSTGRFTATSYARFYATKFLGMTKEEFEEKKYNSNLYIKCFYLYEDYVNLKCDYDELVDLKEKMGVSVASIAKEYAEFNHMDEEYAQIVEAREKNQDDLSFNRSKKSSYYETIEKLELDFDLTEFTYLALYESLDLYPLKGYCFDYLIIKYRGGLSAEEFKEKLTLLRERLELVRESVKDVKSARRKEEIAAAREKRKLALRSYALNIVQRFVDTKGAKVYCFAKDNGLSLYKFSQLVEIVEEANPQLYAKYRIKTKANSAQSYLMIVQTVSNVLACIKHGITNPDTNHTRKFTLFDYLDIVPRSYSDYSDFMKLAKEILDVNDLNLLNTFIARHPMPSSHDDTNVIMKMKFVAHGEIIPGAVKMSVVNYMRKRKIPVTLTLFKLGIRRYLDDELFAKKNETSDENHPRSPKKR